MAIIADHWCEDCAEYDDVQTPAEHEWDTRYQGSGGLFLCDRHASRRVDCASDAKSEGSTPQVDAYAAQRDRDALRQRD